MFSKCIASIGGVITLFAGIRAMVSCMPRMRGIQDLDRMPVAFAEAALSTAMVIVVGLALAIGVAAAVMGRLRGN